MGRDDVPGFGGSTGLSFVSCAAVCGGDVVEEIGVFSEGSGCVPGSGGGGFAE
jgi:hypothetical protein